MQLQSLGKSIVNFNSIISSGTGTNQSFAKVLEGNFRRTKGSLKDIELTIGVDRNIKQISDDEYEIILDTRVADDMDKLSVSVKCMAIFETAQENKELIERNAIAIMFPYVRSYISILTTQPGMTPIVLPAMNVVAMLNDK